MTSTSTPAPDWAIKFYNPPHIVQLRKQMASKDYKVPSFQDTAFHERAFALGFYDNSSELDNFDEFTWEARKIACSVSLSVVGVVCRTSGRQSSGIVVEWAGGVKVLTSAYVLGNHTAGRHTSYEVQVFLPNRKTVDGHVISVDEHHNFAILHSELDGPRIANIATKTVDLGDVVVAVGHHLDYMLKGSSGKINLRGDHFECDDLLSSSCKISQWGIGGPLVDVSSGTIIGMNFYRRKGFTPFMPGSVLINCMQQLNKFGAVIRPWLGVKTRSLTEIKIDELESFYQEFNSTDGLFVKEVINGSPADRDGILVGDLFICCYGSEIVSPPQLAEALLKFACDCKDASNQVKRMANSLEVVIRRLSSADKNPISLHIQPLGSLPELIPPHFQWAKDSAFFGRGNVE